MKKDQRVLRYEEAASVLPVRLRKLAMALPDDQKGAAEEFRLRTGQPLTVLLPSGEVPLDAVVEPEELDTLCDIATEFSRYAAAETLREGYLSVRGGFRVGLCGTAVMKNGANTTLKDFSAAAVRIARQSLLPRSAKLFRQTCCPDLHRVSKSNTLLRCKVPAMTSSTASPPRKANWSA